MDKSTRQILVFIGLVGLSLVLFYGGLVWMIQDSKRGVVEENAEFHTQNIQTMKSAVNDAQARCQAASLIRPDTLAHFNPFAGQNADESVPDSVYADNAADLMFMLNQGFRSLQETGSTAYVAIEGNLFPVNGICGQRLNNVSDALTRYAH